ncbi:15-hydroxyprostaglandin dehydrogenase [NAD(+)]-like [Amphiura filiformis]|uniref:15-hydroxyprostaglandin dehydrogenase [NAD(+)]-like n=1 Tax=Amphiura filiformis TaxID=82378 RepID=UPI003B228C68
MQHFYTGYWSLLVIIRPDSGNWEHTIIIFSYSLLSILVINNGYIWQGGIVTGGASGIGKAMVEMLLKQAKVVYIADINENTSKQIQEEFNQKYGNGKVCFFKCDTTSAEEMEACFKEVKSSCGALHIVCNNAGIYDEVNWQRMLEINVNGVIIGTKLAVEYMDGESAGGGVIVNVASVAGLALIPFGGIYATSKYAVIGFSRMTATFDPVVIKKKLRVNMLCPPTTDTPLTKTIGAMKPEPRYQKGMTIFFLPSNLT